MAGRSISAAASHTAAAGGALPRRRPEYMRSMRTLHARRRRRGHRRRAPRPPAYGSITASRRASFPRRGCAPTCVAATATSPPSRTTRPPWRHAACRRAAAGDKAGDEGCGLRCGQGFVNLVGHAASNDCTALEAHATPAASSSDFDRLHNPLDRPAWSAAPPAWLCRAGSLAAEAAAAAAGAKTSSMLGHGAHATP